MIWDDETIGSLCRRYGIRELFLFGSALGPDFSPDSDLDFLVRLEPGKRLRVRDLLAIEDELAALTGRRIDIVLGSEIDAPDANPIRRRRILGSLRRVYAS
jgi:predicted nucleotidyltransferase